MDSFKLTHRKNLYGDFVIRCYRDGVRYPEGDYYTNDWKDACDTLAVMGNGTIIESSRLYVGCNGAKREIFRSSVKPTEQTHPQYAAVIGPFRTKRGALFMVQHSHNNPHCQTVGDAERLAAKYAGQSELCEAAKNNLTEQINANRN